MDYWLFQQINGLAKQWAWLDWLGIFLASYCQYLVVGALLLFVLAGKTKKELPKHLIEAAALSDPSADHD